MQCSARTIDRVSHFNWFYVKCIFYRLDCFCKWKSYRVEWYGQIIPTRHPWLIAFEWIVNIINAKHLARLDHLDKMSNTHLSCHFYLKSFNQATIFISCRCRSNLFGIIVALISTPSPFQITWMDEFENWIEFIQKEFCRQLFRYLYVFQFSIWIFLCLLSIFRYLTVILFIYYWPSWQKVWILSWKLNIDQKSHKIDNRILFVCGIHIYKILSTSISYLIQTKMALITWDHTKLMKSKNAYPFTSKKLFQRRNHACWWRASLACINLHHKSLVNEYQPLCLISPQIHISYIVFFYTYSVPFSLMVNP